MERRLAAVMIADVAGYGRLSQADEEGTRARFQADLHEVFEPRIAAHHGRLVKTMGDGLLVEFHSVVDAVRCAVEVQRAKAEREGGAPDGHRLEFRIGINLGDVIVEGDDIHGDGVNIADRLQSLADPGGVAISGAAYDQVEKKLDVGFAFLGEQRVKNIDKPVRVYRVLIDPSATGKTIGDLRRPLWSWPWPAAAAVTLILVLAGGAAVWWRPWEPKVEPASIERMALPLPDKPSIAVLPFANMSGDAQQDYFADGITDDLITELSKVSGLFVISRNSTFGLKGKIVPPKQVSEEFGVRYVLEGSVQRSGDRLRINAQLIDALSGGHVWADRFDGSLADVFTLQDKVTRSIADALAIRLTDAEQAALNQQETRVPAAYEAFLRGWEHYRRTTPDDFAKAKPYFEQAIKLDPNYSRAYAALAMLHIRVYDWEEAGSAAINWNSYDEAVEYLRKAKQHPTSTAHQAAGNVARSLSQFETALTEFKAAIALDPSDSWSYAYMGYALIGAGRAADAIAYINTAMRLDPHYPPIYLHFLGLAQFATNRLEDAAATLERATMRNPDDPWSFMLLAAAYAHLGREREATSAVSDLNALRVKQGAIPLTVPVIRLYQPADTHRLIEGLQKAGVPVSLNALFSGEFGVKNRLGADEVRSLFFGHKLRGRTFATHEEHAASVTTDGIASLSGDWGYLDGGTVRFEGDRLCFDWTTGVGDCGTVFRNPGGTRAKENEFIWHTARGAFTFSQIE